MATKPTIHVEPTPRGRWVVRRDGEREPLSEHEDATEATQAASERVAAEGPASVLVHDLYARVRLAERTPGAKPGRRRASH